MQPHLIVATLIGLLALATPTLAADYRCDAKESPPGIHNSPELRIATLNIAHGRGQAMNQMFVGADSIRSNLDKAATLLDASGAEILALQELDVNSLWSGDFNHAQYILDRTAFECMAVGIHAQNWLYSFGTGLLSAAQLNDTEAISFDPTPPTTTKGMVGGTLLWSNGEWVRPVRVVSVHLDFSRKSARESQLQAIIDSINATEETLIIMGDFNEEWGNEGSVVQQLVNDAGMVVFQPESQNLATYKDKRLDWILISDDLEFVDSEVLVEEISDHRLVTATIRWKGSK